MNNKTILKEVAVMSNNELNELVVAVKARRAALSRNAVATFGVGDRVSFVGRGGESVFGTVEKTAIKNVTVKTDIGRWKVSGTLLSMA
jgi:hypothetical protein